MSKIQSNYISYVQLIIIISAIVCSILKNTRAEQTATNTTNDLSATVKNDLLLSSFPATCSGRKSRTHQPVKSKTSKLKKCCPEGEQFYNNDITQCKKQTSNIFKPDIIEASFFENCIEDLETNVTLDILIQPPCHGEGYEVGGSDDTESIYILQNGSMLLINIDEKTMLYEFYDIYNDYCIETMDNNNRVMGVVCSELISKDHHHKLSKMQTHLTAICMLISVPCLLITAFFHLAIPKLRNLHGETLAGHSICLACGFGLLGLTQINVIIDGGPIGYFIQYFILACFFWMVTMSLDLATHVWYFLPNYKEIEDHKVYRIVAYFSISMGIPLIFVFLTLNSGLSGMPSYYMKGMTEATILSQKFFIPPICIVLVINFMLVVSLYIGFQKLQKIHNIGFIARGKLNKENLPIDTIPELNSNVLEEIKRTTKSAVCLFSIMTLNWIFEIVSFYFHQLDGILILFDLLNALQGILIFIMFICMPHYSKIIKRWWIDRGSLSVSLSESEMQSLNRTQNTTLNTTLD